MRHGRVDTRTRSAIICRLMDADARDITVEHLDGDRWLVRVEDRTEHEVTASPEALRRAAPSGDEPPEETLRRAFVFLLEREPPESILRSFSLDVVARYFPDFWSVMSGTR